MHVVITGASAGVGRATAHAFARRGCRLGLIARDRDALEDTLREVRALGGEGLALPVDVADADAVEHAAVRAERHLGPIDVWVNNAMATVFARFADVEPAEFERATMVTYLGMVNGTRAALARMRPRDRGVVVQVGSALSYRAIPLQAPYCGAKFACRGFTDSLRSELLHDGSHVRLTMVQLPALDTPQFEWALSRMPRHPQPVPPIFEPKVAAEAIVWATTANKREVWVGWPTVKAILANKLVPGLLDAYLARTNYEAQQTDQPVRPDRPSNLFRPARGWHATRGTFGRGARSRSRQLWLSMNRRPLAAAVAVFAGSALAALLAARAREPSPRLPAPRQ